MVTDKRLEQLATDPLVCISEELREVALELLKVRHQANKDKADEDFERYYGRLTERPECW